MELETVTAKICNKCNIEKPLEFFTFSGNYYRADCKSCVATRRREYKLNNPDKIKANNKRYYENNKENLIQKAKDYEKNNKHININYTLSRLLRDRFRKAFKKLAKRGSAVKDLGCTVEEFKLYLQNKFSEGMNWENHGDWHIDHIIPLASFDLTDTEEVKKACHYTNLQPLWAEDNLKKGAKYEDTRTRI